MAHSSPAQPWRAVRYASPGNEAPDSAYSVADWPPLLPCTRSSYAPQSFSITTPRTPSSDTSTLDPRPRSSGVMSESRARVTHPIRCSSVRAWTKRSAGPPTRREVCGAMSSFRRTGALSPRSRAALRILSLGDSTVTGLVIIMLRLAILDVSAIEPACFSDQSSVYCSLCTVHCVLCTVYCVLCTVYCLLFTDHCSLVTACVSTVPTRAPPLATHRPRPG